jgi:hypothetical protein
MELHWTTLKVETWTCLNVFKRVLMCFTVFKRVWNVGEFDNLRIGIVNLGLKIHFLVYTKENMISTFVLFFQILQSSFSLIIINSNQINEITVGLNTPWLPWVWYTLRRRIR